jgi:hypothetical protein
MAQLESSQSKGQTDHPSFVGTLLHGSSLTPKMTQVLSTLITD